MKQSITIAAILASSSSAFAAPPLGTEKGHYTLDIDGDKAKDDAWLVTTPDSIPKDVEVVFPLADDKSKPAAGKLAIVIARKAKGAKTTLLVANELLSTPMWTEGDVSKLIHVKGKKLAIATESGEDMYLVYKAKKFVITE